MIFQMNKNPKFNKSILEGFKGDPLKELPMGLSLVREVPRHAAAEVKQIYIKHYRMDHTVHRFYKSISKSFSKSDE